MAKLKQLHGPIAAALRRALHSASSGAAASGIALLPLAAASLAAGEECHAATTAATAALRGLLQPHLEPAGAVLSAAEAVAAREAVAFLGSAPSLFLNLWMAGCKRILMAAEGTADSSVVTAVGGNGLMVGVQLAGGGGWAAVAAAVPEPRALAPPVGGAPAAAVVAEGEAVQPAVAVAGAMGDSMVVDALGFGAQLQPVLPLPPPAVASPAVAPGPLGLAAHPAFSQPGFVPAATAAGAAGPVRIGISAAAVLAIPVEATTEPPLPPAVGADGAATAAVEVAGEASRRPPQPQPQPRPPPPASALAVNLSALDGKGQLGIVGRGVYRVPREALQQAVSRLAFVRPRP